MSWRSALDDALDQVKEPGAVDVTGEGGEAQVQVTQVGAIGVRVRRVRMQRDGPRDVAHEAGRLAGGLRCLPDTLVPIEVDPGLGGATLRSDPQAMREREFFELGLDASGGADLSRKKVEGDGRRTDVDWTMTRDDLGRLLDELA